MKYLYKIKRSLFLLGIGCLSSGIHAGTPSEKGEKIHFLVKKEIKYQVIDNFGASDAWRIAFIGKYWPIEKREQIADLLFSTRLNEQGDPVGIGLSNWRVNIGAGSYENRENGEVTSVWNQTECFLSPEGTYDFTKQAGQQWFMQAARERGVNDFLFFTNSAPYFMTRSGSTLAPDKKSINLQEDRFDAFADFLTVTARHFIEKGFPVRYISPINEPQIDWSANKWQEGSFATNPDAYRLITALDKALSRHNVSAKIVFGEVCDMKYLFDCDTSLQMPDNILEEFFTPSADYPITRLKNVYNCVSAHDYWSAYPVETLVGLRKKIGSALSNAGNGTKLWASEYCILEKNEDINGEPSPERSMDLGLYVARIIHSDLAIANASAWQWWTAVSFGEDVPIQLKPKKDATAGSLKYDGIIHPTKMLWITGNFSRFIRPGMWRISLERMNLFLSDQELARSLMGSAYTDGERTVLVFINYEKERKEIKVEFSGTRKSGHSVKGDMYVTSIDQNLKYCGRHAISNLVIPARSVVTVVI